MLYSLKLLNTSQAATPHIKLQRRSRQNVVTKFWKQYSESNQVDPQKAVVNEKESKVESDVLQMSSETLKAYHQAQKNMQELNNSRITALQELRSAKKRIKELESMFLQAEEQAKATLTTQQSNFEDTEDKEQVVSQQEQIFSFKKDKEQTQEQDSAEQILEEEEEEDQEAEVEVAQQAEEEHVDVQSQEEMQQQVSQENKTNTIVLSYQSGWEEVYLHFNADGKGWTETPGWHMTQVSQDGLKSHQLQLECSRIEFVLNNGHNDWDTPSPESNKKNYTINTPGVYKLDCGVIQKLQ